MTQIEKITELRNEYLMLTRREREIAAELGMAMTVPAIRDSVDLFLCDCGEGVN